LANRSRSRQMHSTRTPKARIRNKPRILLHRSENSPARSPKSRSKRRRSAH
jgi:hypothetical protein